MNIPLLVIEKPKSLTIIRNRELVEVPFSEKPYVLCQTAISNNKPKEYTDLYTKEKVVLGREEFEDLNEAREFYRTAGQRGVYFNSLKDQYLLDNPDYFRQYPHTEPLRILRIDIECLSDGSGVFPKPSKVPIIALGYGKRNYPQPAQEPQTFMDFKADTLDRGMLEDFVKMWKEYDPDIVTGYNVWFDIEYIIGRLQKNKMGLNFLTRDGSMPFFQGRDGMRFNLAGRVVMDLFENVKRDQSLLGIKNRKLKTVCEKFQIPAISVDTKDMREIVNTPKLKEYNLSDIRVLDNLLNIYLPQQITLAEMIGLPLNDVVNGFSSTIPKIYTGRRLITMGMIPLDNNEDRYGDTRFEAAYVDILKTGRFETVYKLDFASQYPTIMMTFNLGPDTVKLLSQEPYDPLKFDVHREGDTLFMVIPDENFQKNMVIRVDLSKDSFIREDMLKLYKMRAELKKALKTSEGAERQAIDSKSTAIKVLMNTIFGFMGLKYSRFGDMAVGVAIVGLARWLTTKAVERIKDKVIEIDTDGIYLDADVDLDEMNTLIAGLVAETVGQECYLRFEKEGTWVGYFYKSKNYILMKKDGTIIFHGVAFKSSKNARLRDRFVQEIARATLMGANQESLKEQVLHFRDLTNYELNDFLMHISLSKAKYDTGMQVKLIAKAEAVLQRKVVAGESIDYFKTPDGYEVSENITSIDQLDKEYYLEVINKAQEIFGLQDIHKTPEEIAQEARQKKRSELIQYKRRLREYSEGDMIDNEEFSHMSVEAAKTEMERITTIQECITKKWPCPACAKDTDRELNYPEGIKCVCGWIGIPPKPAKKVRTKKVKGNVPCEKCGRTDLPLHTDYMCAECSPKSTLAIPREQWGERIPF
jgi:DNA polymerase I